MPEVLITPRAFFGDSPPPPLSVSERRFFSMFAFVASAYWGWIFYTPMHAVSSMVSTPLVLMPSFRKLRPSRWTR